MRFWWLGAAAVLAVPTNTLAEPPTTGAPTLTCELHVWPAERLAGVAFSLYNGLIQGRTSEGQIDEAMKDLLSPSSQVTALRDADLITELRLSADTRIIRHQEPLDRKTVNKIKTRRSQSSSPCYAELIMMDHTLIEDIVWGDRFSSLFMFRTFNGIGEASSISKGLGGNKLKVLTLTEAARPADAPELVAAAVRANFQEYAKNARRKMPPQS